MTSCSDLFAREEYEYERTCILARLDCLPRRTAAGRVGGWGGYMVLTAEHRVIALASHKQQEAYYISGLFSWQEVTCLENES
jgi:hypothetical protein